jgi:hypothetical protein
MPNYLVHAMPCAVHVYSPHVYTTIYMVRMAAERDILELFLTGQVMQHNLLVLESFMG